MASDERDQIIAEMESIRRLGLGAAQQLNHDMTRLTDWREYVRATPLPFVVAAATVGFFIAPGRGYVGRPSSTLESDEPNVRLARTRDAGLIVSSMRSNLLRFAGRWIQTLVGDFLKQQIRSVVELQNDRTDRRVPTQTYRDGSRRFD